MFYTSARALGVLHLEWGDATPIPHSRNHTTKQIKRNTCTHTLPRFLKWRARLAPLPASLCIVFWVRRSFVQQYIRPEGVFFDKIAAFFLLRSLGQQYIRPEDLFWKEITVPREKGSQPLCTVAQTDAKTVDQPNAGGKALCIPLQIARKKIFFCNFEEKMGSVHESVIYTTPNRLPNFISL